MALATLNGKLKFVSENSTSTSLALTKVTAFLVAAPNLGQQLTFFVSSSSQNPRGQTIPAWPASSSIHTSSIGRSSISAIMHTPKITVGIQPTLLAICACVAAICDGVWRNDDTGTDNVFSTRPFDACGQQKFGVMGAKEGSGVHVEQHSGASSTPCQLKIPMGKFDTPCTPKPLQTS